MPSSLKNSGFLPALSGDDVKYKRRYKALRSLVNELSDESTLLAYRVHQIQRRIYDHHVDTYGRPPSPVEVPPDAGWGPLIQNVRFYPADTGAPPPPKPEESAAESPAPSINDDMDSPVSERRRERSNRTRETEEDMGRDQDDAGKSRHARDRRAREIDAEVDELLDDEVDDMDAHSNDHHRARGHYDEGPSKRPRLNYRDRTRDSDRGHDRIRDREHERISDGDYDRGRELGRSHDRDYDRSHRDYDRDYDRHDYEHDRDRDFDHDYDMDPRRSHPHAPSSRSHLSHSISRYDIGSRSRYSPPPQERERTHSRSRGSRDMSREGRNASMSVEDELIDDY